MTGRQIPSQIWKDPTVATTEAFMEGAGLRPTTDQTILCAHCVREGDETPSNTIVIVEGTSLCINHSKNMLN